MKKIFCLLFAMLTMQINVYAVPNYTYTTINDESYRASSPVGYSANYYPNSINTTAYPSYYGYTQTMPQTISYTEIPQYYDKRTVSTQTFRDEREGIDKAIDRSGRIVGVLGIAAILSVTVAAIINAI